MEFLSDFTLEELTNPITRETITEKLEQLNGIAKVSDYIREARYEMEINKLILK